MKNNKKIAVRVMIVLAIFVVVMVGIMSLTFMKTFKAIDAINVNNNDLVVALNSVDDGTYVGECSPSSLTSATVEVTVKNHKIENIKLLEHVYGKGKPAEVITGKVVKAQSLEVDLVSGATGSSKVILKAIENAVLKK